MFVASRKWDEARRKVESEGECRNCGSGYMLEAAHTTYRRYDGKSVDPLRVIPLCKQCHMKYDAHDLDILACLSYDEQALAVKDMGIVRAYKRLTGQSILENESSV